MRWRRVYVVALLALACGGRYQEDDSGSAHGSAVSPGDSDGGVTDASTCPTPPDCNWCNGEPQRDGNNCVVGYACANGADPCKTTPCTADSCEGSAVCGSDGLCWFQGACSMSFCNGAAPDPCQCVWNCMDGSSYDVRCEGGASSFLCECRIGGALVRTCEGSFDPSWQVCEMFGCCNFFDAGVP